MMSKLITVATATNSAEAQFIANRLNSAGIETAIADDNVVSMDYLFGNAVGWIKIQVRELDLERAEAILDTQPPPVDEDEIPWDQTPEEDDETEGLSEEELERRVAERVAPEYPEPVADETEQLVWRAYRTAIIGIFVFPPLLHIFSFLMLRHAQLDREHFSETTARRFYLAYLTTICCFLVFSWFWAAGLIYLIWDIAGALR